MNFTNKKIIKKIVNKNYKIVIAESCTGGLLSSEFTKISGVSKSFLASVIVYSNKSKIKLLKIKKNKLEKYGAVSKEIVFDMAKNIKQIFKSDISISTSGIAGPKGGSNDKPVGLVYICVIFKNKKTLIKKNYKGSRITIQKKVVNSIFKILENII